MKTKLELYLASQLMCLEDLTDDELAECITLSCDALEIRPLLDRHLQKHYRNRKVNALSRGEMQHLFQKTVRGWMILLTQVDDPVAAGKNIISLVGGPKK